MSLQLLKRNYTMQGYEAPKILKLPQGETRWAPRRLPVDIGDVMMNVRMDDSKNKYIGEHVSKYAQGSNPYGEWGYPYKVNKNNIRPPIIDPKFYQPLSRMPVKFDSVTAGPIVKHLYEKRTEISQVAPQTIIDKVCPNIGPRPSARGDNYTDNSYHEGSIDLHLKQPRASIPYHPSMPVHINTGVPQIELDPKIMVRPQMGIHAPYNISDQSRDVFNMRTPMHVAVQPGYKAPNTSVLMVPDDTTAISDNILNIAANSNIVAPVPTIDNLTRDGYDLTPKVQTSAHAPPSWNLVEMADRQMSERVDPMIGDVLYTSMKAPSSYKKADHDGHDVFIPTRPALHASRTTNLSSRLNANGEVGECKLPDALHLGHFDGKADIPHIQEHQTFTRTRDTNPKEYFFIEDRGKYGDAIPGASAYQQSVQYGQNVQNVQKPQITGIRNKLQLQESRIDRTGLEPTNRVIPVGTGRFIHNTF